MFVDRARIHVRGGAGGNGCCSFRREKYVPRGGPDGGDGGDGGDVYIVADVRLSSLLDLHDHSTWIGSPGGLGKGKNQHGKKGEDVVIPVPPGTVILDANTNEVIAELVEPGSRLLAAHGGRGGKGNARFTTSSNRAPKFAELGEPGEEAEYRIELKLIAEVGLVGLPNAGKSTFLARVTAATPKIADYPFTTLTPNLGVAQLSDYRTLTIADIPGIIEGAAEGKGLGHDFLKHIERTEILLFIIDLGDADPSATCGILNDELAQYSPVFAERPVAVALNKSDIPENSARFDRVAQAFEQPFLISAATGEGIPPLMEHLWAAMDKIRKEEGGVDIAADVEREYKYEAPYTIEKTGDSFQIEGKVVTRVVSMTDFSNNESVQHLQNQLRHLGIFKALRRMGAKEGQPVLIGGVELEYKPD